MRFHFYHRGDSMNPDATRSIMIEVRQRADAVVDVGASGRTRDLGRAEGLWLSYCKARGATRACLDDSHPLRIWTLPLVRGSTA